MKEPESPCVSPSTTNPAALTVKGVRMSASQRDNAETIMQVAEANDLPVKAMVVAIMTAIQESTLENLDYGYPGSTSIGLFQQIEAWGPYTDRHDPEKSTEMFFFGGQAGQAGLTDIDGWEDMEPGDAAQAVQHSGYPDAYATHLKEATAIVEAYTSESSSGRCDTVDILSEIVNEAISHDGDSYTWTLPADGASFVSAMFATQGISIPAEIAKLYEFEGDAEAGVEVKFIPASGIGSLERGDVLFWGSEDNPTQTGIYIGSSLLELKIASYNVLGSSHTAATGENSGPNRIVDAARLIVGNRFSVVGLQELQRNQRTVLMEELGKNWAIWPEEPIYYDSKQDDLPNSQNSIIYDTTQVELIRGESGSLPMPYYFAGERMPRDIPLVKFRQISTGRKFSVANTHDPTKKKNADLRKRDAEQHARDMDALVAAGETAFFTGDFNSGYQVVTAPHKANTTLGGKRENLTWCIMTKSGAMVNGYDAVRKRTGCPMQTTKELGVGRIDHVYASIDVDVTDYAVISQNQTASDHPVVYITASLVPPAETQAGQPDKFGYYVGPRASDGKITVQPVRKANFLGALRFSFNNVSGIKPDGTWTLPLAEPYVLTNHFGQLETYYASGAHTGEDFAPSEGNSGKVFAATNGKIITVGWDPDGFGNYVVEEISNGHTLWYAHLSSTSVRVGDTVRTGQQLGIAGETGHAYGVHLHYEERDADGNPIDPFPALREHGVDP